MARCARTLKPSLPKSCAFWLKAALLSAPLPLAAAEVGPEALTNLPQADVVLLGETHDNGIQHARQAEALAALAPSAVIFEMLSPEQAEIVNTSGLSGAELGEALDWVHSGWPDFALYQPVFDALGEARAYGMAVPRAALGPLFEDGPVAAFGEEAARFGLDQPLSEDEQTTREAEQLEAHCNALPEDLLPTMVAAQRFRDAAFARSVLQALEDTGGPVAVIVGNGHVRKDWGMPVYLAKAAPEVSVLALGQVEDFGQASDDLPYDLWILSEPAEREDPCAAFAK